MMMMMKGNKDKLRFDGEHQIMMMITMTITDNEDNDDKKMNGGLTLELLCDP